MVVKILGEGRGGGGGGEWEGIARNFNTEGLS